MKVSSGSTGDGGGVGAGSAREYTSFLEVQRRTGLSRGSIHYYEERGWLGDVRRRDRQRRRYTKEQVDVLEQMAPLVRIGIPSHEAWAIVSANGSGPIRVGRERLRELLDRELEQHRVSGEAIRLLLAALMRPET